MRIKRYAGIGSRETPRDVLKTSISFANILAELGYGLSSGGCPLGMDAACLEGAYKHRTFDKSQNRIYLSWNGMANWRHDPSVGLYDAQRFSNYEEAQAIGLRMRGSWNGLGRGGIAHHSRNPYQVLGDDLKSPVDFVFTWAIPVGKNGNVKGGTGTAVKLALENNIPVYNLYYDEMRERIEHFILNVKLHKLNR